MLYGEPHGQTCLSCEAGRRRKIRATPEGRAKANAASVKYIVARLKVDAWFRLRYQIAGETRKLVKQLAIGKGTEDACQKLFGTDRWECICAISEQLDRRGFQWQDYGEVWVLDHRVPLGSAQSDVELLELGRLGNCQVLTVGENVSKVGEDLKFINAAGY